MNFDKTRMYFKMYAINASIALHAFFKIYFILSSYCLYYSKILKCAQSLLYSLIF